MTEPSIPADQRSVPERVVSRLRGSGAQVRELTEQVETLRARADNLADRCLRLEQEIQETRSVNLRLAQVMDGVEHLIVDLASGEQPVEKLVTRYRAEI